MSSESPASVLFSSDGTELAVVLGSAVPAGTRHLLTNEINNEFTVQSAATVTTSGSQLVVANYFGTQEIALVVNVGTVTGSGSIQYTIQEVDPGDGITVYGNSTTTSVINTGNTPGVFTAVLNITTSPSVKVSWVVIGTFSATIYSTVVTKSTPSTQVISGSITATNPSVGTDGAASLTSDTQVGGITTTAAPTYTTGNLDALSLTTKGGLRIDGVFPTGAAVPISDAMYVGGAVTTAAPSYTTGQMDPLSLTTSGLLRVDGTGGIFNDQSVGADAATALGFDTQVGGKTTTAAPTYVTGNLDALSLTTLGGLRIDGVYVVGTANATAADVMNSGGYVTTAAPTYTTGQLNPLSLDTSGNLRVTGFVVTNKAATSSVTSVAVTASTNTTLLTANAARIFASIYNGSNKTIYIKLGTTASLISYSIQLFTGSYWEIPNDWIGNIDEFSPVGASGSVLITELST